MKKLVKLSVLLFCVCLTQVLFAQSDISRRSMNLSGFNAIQASGIATVYLTKGATEKVEVEVNEKYRDHVKVSVDGHVLNIKWDNTDLQKRKNYDDAKLKVYVTYKSLTALTGSGATNFYTQNKLTTPSLSLDVSGANNSDLEINAGKLTVDASGAANIKLAGKTDQLFIDASGACNIKAYDLRAGNVDADVSGVSNASITAEKKLDVEASGLSNVNYKGNPQIGKREIAKMSGLHKH